MPTFSKYLGDSGGNGHELKVIHQDDGTVVLVSHNPDTDEFQRVVLMENQWRLLLCTLFEVYGREKCCYFRGGGVCGTTAALIEA